MAFGLARLDLSPTSDLLRDVELRNLVDDAAARLRAGRSLRATVALGAVAEELGFPEIAQRLFTWTRNAASWFGDDAGSAQRAAAPAQSAHRPARVPPEVLGFLLFQAGQFAAARSEFARQLAAQPFNVAAAIHLARTQTALGEANMDIVRTLTPLALVDSPRRDELLKELASALFRAGDPYADQVSEIVTRHEREAMAAVVAELERALRDGLVERPATDPGEPAVDHDLLRAKWLFKRTCLEFLKPHEDHASFSHLVVQEAIREALRAHPQIATVIDAGAMYGHIDAALAREFPATSFVEVVPSDEIRALGEASPGPANLRYAAGGLAALLAGETFAPDVLVVHARTVRLLYPAAVRSLYAAAFRGGVRHIVAVEDLGINRATGHFTRFGRDTPPTTPFRGDRYGHDYDRYLAEAGYDVTDSHVVPMTTLWKRANKTDAHLHVVHATLRPEP